MIGQVFAKKILVRRRVNNDIGMTGAERLLKCPDPG